MEFFRQEYWSGLPFPSPEEIPNSGIEPWSPALQAGSLPFELQGSPYIHTFYTDGNMHLILVCLLSSYSVIRTRGCSLSDQKLSALELSW